MKYLHIILAAFLFSCNQENKVVVEKTDPVSDSIKKLSMLDVALPKAQPGDWLYEHQEKGQSFLDYKKCKPVSPDSIRNKIYIQYVGNFSPAEDSVSKCTIEYLKVFFGLDVLLLPEISISKIPDKYKRIREDGHEQFLTKYILDSLLISHLPEDGIALMAITNVDLYPDESWNYVFGQAYTWKKVGISSIYRYMHDTDTDLCLRRLIQTSSHEIGHMFSLLHCTNAICNMNGSNGLWESDSRPCRLCSECLNKLCWNLKFINARRFDGMISFFKKYNMKTERQLAEKDFEVYLK